MTEACFHCAEPVPAGLDLTVDIDGAARPVCCRGCQAVAELITAGGNAAYYRYRDRHASRPDESALDDLARWQAFDTDPATDADGIAETGLLIEGLHCSACAWLIERQLGALPGVESVRVDVQTGHGVLRWRPADVALSAALKQLVRLGYGPHPLDHAGADASQRNERNDMLKRLAVAGLGMMQVMMYAVGAWFGPERGMDPAIERLLQLVSMLIATPVVFYAGAPFLVGAWRSLRARQPNMDVPVTVALLLAYGASVINFFRAAGPTYFESATMFVFLLTTARFVAMQVRHRATDARLALAPMLPDVVIRVRNNRDARITRAELRDGDVIRVRPGDAVAADGVILLGRSEIDESLLTGESALRSRAAGDPVMAGSINHGGSITVRVTATGNDTRVARMASLLARARGERPARVQLADRIAGRFVVAVLAIAAAVFAGWWHIDPGQAFNATLAVLVVTCPCALSLAIPSALSAAATRLARGGVLLTQLDALETLTRVSRVLFDKTGTLSRGAPEIGAVIPNPDHPYALDADGLLRLTASLERHSSHPLARAFTRFGAAHEFHDVESVAGRGIQGQIGGRTIRIGNARFGGRTDDGDPGRIYVSDDHGPLGVIELTDAWRPDAAAAVSALRARGLATEVLSGDHAGRVSDAVTELGIDAGTGALLPEQKLAAMRRRQAAGDTVLAVGDGVNDIALLAGADVSVAIADGAEIAQAGADIVLTGSRLTPVAELFRVAARVRAVTRQNIGWAIGYNAIAVPAAALGLIGPALAALGMSLSSLVVVLNAARLARYEPERAAPRFEAAGEPPAPAGTQAPAPGTARRGDTSTMTFPPERAA
jgi:Cu2+-exporting ATPase